MTSRPAPARRVVFLDVDGTITAHGGRISPRTPDAVRAARANGHLVLLCTGRAAGDIPPDVAAIGFDGAITDSGVLVTVGDDVVLDRPLPRERARFMIETMDSLGVHYVLQADGEVYANEGMNDLLQEHERAIRERTGAVRPEDSLSGLVDQTFPPAAEADLDRVAKAVFVCDEEEGFDELRQSLGDGFHLVRGSIPLPGGSNGEANEAGVTKGSAIERLLPVLGMDAADAVAVGDSWNDVEMFQVCGVSVAMGNAHPELKELADVVTTDVLDDGIWNAFVRLGLAADCSIDDE
ncbi:Cof-type HAD-IIB family hydrolase [Microbacterium sp.]|uniref:Cof-type HAD-IIB family hydrolase n=1 Tax=Microbacterium sp. TaxID=51671 RepID=UPI0039E26C75